MVFLGWLLCLLFGICCCCGFCGSTLVVFHGSLIVCLGILFLVV